MTWQRRTQASHLDAKGMLSERRLFQTKGRYLLRRRLRYLLPQQQLLLCPVAIV